jgi:probable blue pigment (indigoidine) exporter
MSSGQQSLDGRGALYASLTAILYGTSYVATGIALRSFDPLAAASLRGAVGVIALLVASLLPLGLDLRPTALYAAAFRRLLVLGALGGPLFIVAMNEAVAHSGATITAFVAGLYAVMAAAFGVPLLGERLGVGRVAALVAALIGTALLAELRLTADVLPGIAWGLAAAVAFGLFLVLSRRWSARFGLPGQTVGLATLGLTAVAAAGLVVVTGADWAPRPLTAGSVAAIGWLAVGPGAIAAVLVVAGMRRLPAGRASAFLLLNPPTAALGGYLLLDERLSVLQLVGAALVLAAIAVSSGAAILFRSWSKTGSRVT